jgi:hypothetical protein
MALSPLYLPVYWILLSQNSEDRSQNSGDRSQNSGVKFEIAATDMHNCPEFLLDSES